MKKEFEILQLGFYEYDVEVTIGSLFYVIPSVNKEQVEVIMNILNMLEFKDITVDDRFEEKE